MRESGMILLPSQRTLKDYTNRYKPQLGYQNETFQELKHLREGGRDGGREGGKERGREEKRDGGREEIREGGKERGREGGKERGREGGERGKV